MSSRVARLRPGRRRFLGNPLGSPQCRAVQPQVGQEKVVVQVVVVDSAVVGENPEAVVVPGPEVELRVAAEGTELHTLRELRR